VRSRGVVTYLLGGAAYGALAWCAYGVVEQAFCFLLSIVHGLHAVHGIAEWHVVAALAGAYLIGGGVLGAGAGLALALADRCASGRERSPSADRLRAAAVAAFALTFAAHLAFAHPFGKAEGLSLALALGIAAVVFASLRSEPFMSAYGGAANPWAASLILLGGASIGRGFLAGMSTAARLLGAAAFIAVVAGTAAALSRLARRRAVGSDRFVSLRAVAALGFGVVLVGVLGIVATESPALGSAAARMPETHGPNLILVTMDTVRADHLSAFGYGQQTTPFLDSFARRATTFTNAFATSDQTLTTHASIFTGLYGSWHGAYPSATGFPRGRPLGAAHPTLAQLLAGQGYRTVEIVANYAYLGAAFGLDRGFEECDVLIPSTIADAFYVRERLLPWMGRLLSWPDLYVRCGRARQVERDAVAVLRGEASKGSPFFLFVNYMDAHVPYIPPAPFDDEFPGRSARLGPGDYPRMRAEVMSGKRSITPEERRHFESQYDGAIRSIDGALRNLVETLVKLGLYENSMIVICSDHGEAFGERGLVQHGVSVYQNQIHIPLIIKFPGQHEPRMEAAPVSEVDLMPTILAALGLPVPLGLPGEDLRSATLEQPRTLFSESFYLRGFGHRFERTERAAIRWPMELVVSTTGTREMFDLARDPDEKHDLFRQDEAQAVSLLGAVEDWIRTIPAVPEQRRRLDEDTLRRLRALGYVN
jgi:arylsulfatase A-like enzyme